MSRWNRTYELYRESQQSPSGDSGMQISRASGGEGAPPLERTREPHTERRPPLIVARPIERQDLPLRELQHLLSSDRPQLLAHGSKAYHVTGRQVRALATIGAFRAIPADDLMNRQLLTTSEVTDLREQGLTTHRTVSLHGDTRLVVTLSNDARRALEAHRMPDATDRPQGLHSGLVKPAELPHDAHLYALYEVAAAELVRDGGTIDRVQLDYELKRQYQRFLQASNKKSRPQRTPTEIKRWAEEPGVAIVEGRVKFPAPTEDHDPDGDRARELSDKYREFLRGAKDDQKHADGRPDRTPEEVQGWAERHGLAIVDGRVKFPAPTEDRDPDGDRARELSDQYREFLRGAKDDQKHADGRPDRTPEEIQSWAERHGLAIVDGHVKFPDVRIEYTDANGHSRLQDVELVTANYSARSVAAKRGAGFQVYRKVSATRGSGNQLSRKGSTSSPNLFERLV